MIHIFTDGACPSNGKIAAKAAYAVIIWNLPGYQEPIQIAEKVPRQEPQTNQRAELRAVHRAFEEIRQRGLQGKEIAIWTDSEYVRRSIIEWGPLWKEKGWKKGTNKPISHIDLLKPMIDFYEVSKDFLRILHVDAHTKKTEFPYDGNAAVDELAALTAAI